VRHRNNHTAPWFERLSRPIVFFTVALAVIGAYLAFTIPVSVFPSTDFPRIVIGVDNGVAPIDQMLVTVTKPIEEAVNSVPGLQNVRSITSRGSAEIDLFFDWKSDMVLALQRVDAVVARLQSELPSNAKIETHRLTFAVFPIIGYSLTSDSVPPEKLWEIATYEIKPRMNRLDYFTRYRLERYRKYEEYAHLDTYSFIWPDLARWVAATMPGPDGEPAGRGVLTPNGVAALLAPQPATDGQYGLGYFLGHAGKGPRVAWHAGFNRGWRAYFALLPAGGEGLVVLTNSDNGYYLVEDIAAAWGDRLGIGPVPTDPEIETASAANSRSGLDPL